VVAVIGGVVVVAGYRLVLGRRTTAWSRARRGFPSSREAGSLATLGLVAPP